MNTDKENGKMNYHDTMRFVDEEGKSMNMDRCSFCTRMESLSEHGKCSHFIWTTSVKIVQVFFPSLMSASGAES